MKLTNLALLFFILELSVFTIFDMRINNLTAITNKKIEYNKALDSAIDDGIVDLVEVDSKRDLILNKEIAVNQFYESLYANFGVIGNGILEERLKAYIPVILVTDTDGFYIYYSDAYEVNKEVLITQRWSEKIPFSYGENNLVYSFTLGNYITIYDKSAASVYEGDYHDLKNRFPDSILADDEIFDTVRRNAIISKIEEKMNFYINQHNDIAYQFGITYQFWLPQIDKTDWYRTMDDVSMLVIFQGYPYNAASLDTYNRYALGGARIKKSKVYYITAENGLKYYHKDNCRHLNGDYSNAANLNGTGVSYYTKEECALEGAFPCPACNP